MHDLIYSLLLIVAIALVPTKHSNGPLQPEVTPATPPATHQQPAEPSAPTAPPLPPAPPPPSVAPPEKA